MIEKEDFVKAKKKVRELLLSRWTGDKEGIVYVADAFVKVLKVGYEEGVEDEKKIVISLLKKRMRGLRKLEKDYKPDSRTQEHIDERLGEVMSILGQVKKKV